MTVRNKASAVCAAIAVVGIAVSTIQLARAADWPHWRGPNRDGISAETRLLSQWPVSGPRRVWSVQVGDGYSSAAVAGGKLYTIGNRGNRDTVYCFNAATGAPMWNYAYPCTGADPSGPRTTPAVAGNFVYTLSLEGLALCLNATTGKVVWQRNLGRETNAQRPQWGFSGSPLVESNLVIYNLGTAGTALDRATGRPAWSSGAGAAGYATPVSYTLGNQHGVAIFAASGIVGVNPANGRRYWDFPWQTSYDVNAADPIFTGDTVFISSNYGKGCALLRVGQGRPSLVWQNRNMKNHFNSCVLLNGALYGNDENTLKCIDLKTGAERWQSRGMGKGGLIAADGKQIVLTERGELVLAAATADKYRELARTQVLRGTCWTQPALANGLLYCRSHEGELVCLDMRAK
jgi:outer membrane protein assembly factor BamB